MNCSGGEDSPPTPCLPASFTPAIATVAAGDVFLGEVTSSCNSVEVSVLVNDLSGIWTVAFDLSFPSSVLSYGSFTAGPLLLQSPRANSPTFIVMNPPSSGVLQVSATRLAPDPSVTAVGTQILMTLTFHKVATGTGAIDFDDSVSSLSDVVLDEVGSTRPASFQPDHGGIVIVP